MQHHRQAPRDSSPGRLNTRDGHLGDVVGYRLLGRHGELGFVEGELSPDGDVKLVVRGGVSHALVYHVPRRRIVEVSAGRRTVTADVDVADFAPFLREDGVVVLELAR